jgi:tetratricopeptide (TPR) repeat protein
MLFGVSHGLLVFGCIAVTTLNAQQPQQMASSFSGTHTDLTAPPSITGPQTVTPELKADIMMARKMYREAIESYKQAPQDSPVVLNKIGIAYHQLTELKMAKVYYERSAKMKPDYAEAINNIGTVYYAQKSFRRAISMYKKALVYSPDSASMRMNLGTAYFARKNYELAFATYQEALKLDPEVFEHRGTHGTLLQERSVEELAKFHFYLARTYAKAGANDRALLYLRKALEEGFKERDKITSGADFAGLQNLDEFKQIIAMEQKVL